MYLHRIYVVSLLSPIFADNNNRYTVRKSGTIVTQHKFDANICVYVFRLRKYFFVQLSYDIDRSQKYI